ncbi:MAG: beta-ketoacyl-[acyl-carrier-protein] synthase family protein [Chitinophagaceae bacterium]
MSERVFVAGVGVIAAIGNNTAECLEALENGRAGMDEVTYLNSIHHGSIPVAEVKSSNGELASLTGLAPGISRTALLSSKAAREAFNDAGLKNHATLRIGFVSANTVGGMDKSERFFAAFHEDTQKGRLRDVLNHECGSVTELVADQLGISQYVTTISTACSSSANAVFFSARLIKHNFLDVVIAGGTDALTKFTLNGFNTLMILDREWCKPFDENRKGLNLGEGAGYLVLVSERVAASAKMKIYCELSGYCNANDAFHQTASSPDGTGSFLAMQGALQRSGIHPSQIDYINLHGTGTHNNDIAEGTAVKNLFDPSYPKMSSTKSFTGHTLGASGGLEAVFSVLAIEHGIVFPNLRLDTAMKDLPFVPETVLQHTPVKNVLTNSFGFGGNCSSLIFSKI